MFKLFGALASIAEWLIKRIWSPKAEFDRAKNENARIITEHDEEALNRKLDDRTNRL